MIIILKKVMKDILKHLGRKEMCLLDFQLREIPLTSLMHLSKAKGMKIKTVAFTGKTGGRFKKFS